MMAIKNIVFDVGNVLVRWDPLFITVCSFPECHDQAPLAQKIFKSQIWQDLNLGKLTEDEAILHYVTILNYDQTKLKLLMQTIKETQSPVPGSFELLKKLYQAQFSLFALTDNVKEIVCYLKQKYDFWSLFKGIVVSAEVGFLKPSVEIYQCLLNTYQLDPVETLFIDDHLPNVIGARNVGMHAIQFINASLCLAELEKPEIKFLQN